MFSHPFRRQGAGVGRRPQPKPGSRLSTIRLPEAEVLSRRRDCLMRCAGVGAWSG